MRKFLSDVVCVLLMAVAMAGVVELYVRHLPGRAAMRYDRLADEPASVRILALGHSHFERLNPHLLGRGACLAALPGKDIDYDLQLVRRLLPAMDSLQALVVPMAYTFFTVAHYAPRHQVHWMASHQMHLRPTRWDNYLCSRSVLSSGPTPTQMVRHLRENSGCDAAGYVARPPAPMRHDGITEMLQQTDEALYERLLAQLASECAARGVRLIVVAAPAHDECLRLTTPEGMARMEALAARVGMRFPVEYHNYMADEAFRSDSLYADMSHLNSRGGGLFAARLKHDFSL